jgi:hypothetical protein
MTTIFPADKTFRIILAVITKFQGNIISGNFRRITSAHCLDYHPDRILLMFSGFSCLYTLSNNSFSSFSNGIIIFPNLPLSKSSLFLNAHCSSLDPALSLGASDVMLGTRFLPAKENKVRQLVDLLRLIHLYHSGQHKEE